MPKEHLPDERLLALSAMVTQRLGLDFPRERWADLERGIGLAAAKAGHSDPDDCAKWLLSAPLSQADLALVAGALTVGETYFFRERRSFDLLAEQVLPALIAACQRSGRKLRIWCAGCCTGEEPYSVAILLDRLFPGWAADHATILGTDVNPEFLAKASRGLYSNWSFRSAPLWLKDNYFIEAGQRAYEIAPRIRERVIFRRHNLAEDAFPSSDNGTNDMDLILCRNVTMYFSLEKTRQVIRHLHQCLVDGGHLLVSPTEASTQMFAQFTSLFVGGAIIYRKDKGAPTAKIIPQAPPIAEMPVTTFFPAPAALVAVPPERSVSPVPSPEIPVVAPIAEHSAYDEALAAFERGDCETAAETLRHDPTILERPEKPALLARIYANLGQSAEARDWVEKALVLDKLDASLHHLRALILLEQGNTAEAAAALKRALYLDPKLVMAHFSLGNLAAREGKLDEADRCFANVLSLLGDYPVSDVLPYSDGLAAGRLKEMVEQAMMAEAKS